MFQRGVMNDLEIDRDRNSFSPVGSLAGDGNQADLAAFRPGMATKPQFDTPAKQSITFIADKHCNQSKMSSNSFKEDEN